VRRHSGRSERKLGTLNKRRLDSLSSTVNDLFDKAAQNEKILRRYQQFELTLLDVAGFESLLDMLIRNSVEYFQLECAELWLYDPQSTLTELLPDEYLHIPHLRLLSAADELVTLYGRQPTVRLLSVTSDKELPVFDGLQLRSCALLPLVRHGVIVGSLHFGVKGQQRFTQDKSTDFITHLASVVSVCLENAVNQDRLHRLSMYDMLTQVKNRRAFHLALHNEVSRAARSSDPLSLLFVDFDYFKRINDQHGHPMGDRVLKVVAQYMNNMLRKTDHVCRYGGEEFALVLPNCGCQRALDIAERIRQQVSELTIRDDKGASVKVTLSIGVSGWYEIENNGEMGSESETGIAAELISCSDKGVYLAKAAGRNRFEYIAMQCPSTQQAQSGADFSLDLKTGPTSLEFENAEADTIKTKSPEPRGNGERGSDERDKDERDKDERDKDARRNDVWPEMTL
jgi:diguanylate cyclase (GGDEF)-like protein